MPDKSGLPSAPRGAGALRFGLPSGPLGTPGIGCNGHCVDNDDDTVTMMAVNTAAVNHGFMSTSWASLRGSYGFWAIIEVPPAYVKAFTPSGRHGRPSARPSHDKATLGQTPSYASR